VAIDTSTPMAKLALATTDAIVTLRPGDPMCASANRHVCEDIASDRHHHTAARFGTVIVSSVTGVCLT
jgi:hypothetical protein